MEGILVPIILFLVIGAIFVSWIYYRSKEKQLMIEKGLSHEQMMELLRTKRNPYNILKLGIITVFVGIGVGSGLLIDRYTGVDEWIPFLIITFTGLGFISAFYVARKFEKEKFE